MKRDLRSQDHEPLFRAENAGLPYLIVTLLEPEILSHPDTSNRHVQFIYYSVKDLNNRIPVHILQTEALDFFEFIQTKYSIQEVFSYQESGVMLTWMRDKALANYFALQCIKWTEFQRDGIQRGIKNRNGWDKEWFTVMCDKIVYNQPPSLAIREFEHPFEININRS